jgi:hypothetical protein
MRSSVLAAVIVASLGWVGTAEAGGGLEFNFLTGRRDYQAARFTRVSGDTSPSLISTFQGAPFDGVNVAGVGFEMNLAVDGVRFAFGYAKPYVQFAGPIVTMDPQTRVVSTAQVRSMEATEMLFSLGYQVGFKKARVSFDLLGTASDVTTDIAMDDRQGRYQATGFGFSVRTGVRYPFHKAFYLHASAEAGLNSASTVGGTFGIGSGIP